MPNQAFNMHLHESVLNNFNFDYVYNYFFDPEKLKSRNYQPLRSPSFKEAVVVMELSAEAKKNANDKQVHFFEDFSSTTEGQKPLGWKSGIAQGITPIVVSPDGLNGKWVMMNASYDIIPLQLKKPFPENFTLSFDLVASKDLVWGAKGFTMQL